MTLRKDTIVDVDVPADAPYPDVWLPLVDNVQVLAGNASNDTATNGTVTLTLPTKSASFSRSTTATYIAKSGMLMTAQINEPRFEKDGLLMEGASTNYMLNSSDPSKWSIGSQLTRTVLAADGYSQAPTGKFVVNSAIPVAQMIVSSAFAVVVGDTVTTSFRIKCSTGLVRVVFRMDSVSAAIAYINPYDPNYSNMSGPMTFKVTVLDDGYAYIVATFTAAAAGNCTIDISANQPAGSSGMAVGDEYYLQMPQVEKNSVATSYIPTGASAVTRSYETLSLPAMGNVGYVKLSDPLNRTVALEITVDRMGSWANSYFDMIEANGANYDKIIRCHVNQFESFRSSGSLKMPLTYPIPRQRFCQTIDSSNNLSLYLGTDKSISLLAAPYQPNTGASTLQLKSNSNCVYHIRNFRIWHQLLTPGQIKGLR